MKMPPKPKHLIGNRPLESCENGRAEQHHGQTNAHGDLRNPDQLPGEPLRLGRDFACDVAGDLHVSLGGLIPDEIDTKKALKILYFKDLYSC